MGGKYRLSNRRLRTKRDICQLWYACFRGGGEITMVEKPLEAGAAARQLHDKAYFLDLLGDSHNGLGRYEPAIEAYQQAAQAFNAQGAHCSYALCLFKMAKCHLALDEPWHAIGYLEACLPLFRDLGLTRHERFAQHQLDACAAGLAQARLLGDGTVRPAVDTNAGRPAHPAQTESPQ